MSRHKQSLMVRRARDYDRKTRNIVTLVIWLAVLIIPVTYYGSRYFHGLSSDEAIDIAQIAKQEALGRGFVSGYAKPALMELTNRVFYPPGIVRPPLYIWILSFIPGVREGSDGSVSLCSSIFFLLSGILVFQFARMLSDFSKAIVVLIIYLLSIPMLKAAISGLPYTLTAFLFIFLCFLIYLDRGRSFFLSFLIGAVTGACYLSDYHFLPTALPVALYIIYRRAEERWRFLALFLIGFAAITLPWILRNCGMGLNPFIGFPIKYRMIMGAPQLEEKLTYGKFGLGGFEEFYSYAAIYRKALSNLINIYSRFIRFGGVLIMIAFVGSIFVPYNGLGAVRTVVCSSIILVSLSICLDNGKISGLVPLLPMIILLAVTGMYKIIDNADIIVKNIKPWVIRVFILLSILPFVGAVASAPNPRLARKSMEKSRLVIEELGAIVGAQEIVLTDEPWKLAWYSNVPSILLPDEAEDYELLADRAGNFKFVYLSSRVGREPVGLWSTIFSSRSVPAWLPLKKGHVLSDKSLLLSDRKRW